MKNVYDDRIDTISRILNALPRLQARLDRINDSIYRGGITAAEFTGLVSERSALIKEIHDLEQKARECYNLEVEQTKKSIEVYGSVDLMNN